MAVNHFGHFLMINLLIENILSSEREIVLNGKSTVFKPTPEVVPVIRTKPLMFLLTCKKVNRKKKSRMILDHPYQRHITLIMSLEII